MLSAPQRIFDKKQKLTVPATRSAPPPAFELTPDWSLLWADEFDTSNLDTHKWWTRQTHNGGWLDYLNDEWQRYREQGNHVMGGGCCALTALPKADADGWSYYPSGMLRSKALFPLASGQPFYFECRGKVPGGQGTWPAFWLAGSERIPGDDSSAYWPPEIDVCEIVNNGVEDTTRMCGLRCQVWDWEHNPQGHGVTACVENYNPEWGTWWAPFDFAEDFHTWGLCYERPNYAFYVDRQWIVSGRYDWVTDDGQDSPPAHVLVNLAIGGSWAGRHGVDDAAFPQAFALDYVRVYQRLPQSTIGHDLMPR